VVAPLADVAGTQPAVGALDRARRFGVAPIRLDQVGASHQNLAGPLAVTFGVSRELDLPAAWHAADVPGARIGTALSALVPQAAPIITPRAAPARRAPPPRSPPSICQTVMI